MHACSVMSDSATAWTVARQAPLSMEFSRQEYWRGQPFPSPGDFPDPGIELWSPVLQAISLPPELPGKPLFLLRKMFGPIKYYSELVKVKENIMTRNTMDSSSYNFKNSQFLKLVMNA